MNSCLIVNLSWETRGGMGLEFIEPDPQFFQPTADKQGRITAKALATAIESGYFPRVGNELKVVADREENIGKIFLDGQELVIN